MAGTTRTGALLRLRHRPGAGDGRRQHLLSRRDSLARRASPPGWRWLSRQRLRASRCGRGRAAQADKLRCESQRGLHARMVWRLPAYPRFLHGRPRHARVRLRSQLSLRRHSTEPRITTRPCASTACSIATSATWTHLAHLLGKPADANAGDVAPRRATPPCIAIYGERRTVSLRDYDFIHAQAIDLRVHLVALSAMGRRSNARRSKADGSQAQPIRAARRIVHEQLQHRDAMG